MKRRDILVRYTATNNVVVSRAVEHNQVMQYRVLDTSESATVKKCRPQAPLSDTVKTEICIDLPGFL
jgi:hypothetical protein